MLICQRVQRKGHTWYPSNCYKFKYLGGLDNLGYESILMLEDV